VDHAEKAGGSSSSPSPRPDTPRGLHELPDWAREQAQSELFDVDDDAAVVVRAWEIVRAARQLEEERHDEYDDPDLGGEA
jgi:hypothetical protein